MSRIAVSVPGGASFPVYAKKTKFGFVMEGDIVFPFGATEPMGLGVHASNYYWIGYWPNGVLIYDFDPELPDEHRNLFLSAAKHIEELAGIKFKQRTTEEVYLEVFLDDDTSTCWSYLGYGYSPSRLDLYCGSDGLPNLGVAVHEIMHALGMGHEHTRPDRDKYVTIYWENINKEQAHNFYKRGFRMTPFGDYDYYSVMHYNAYAFSINGEPTIVPKFVGLDEIGQREGLSSGDISALEKAYSLPWISVPSWHLWARVGGYPYIFEAELRNVGAVDVVVEPSRFDGWIRSVRVESDENEVISSGDEAVLLMEVEPCADPGFYPASLSLSAQGNGKEQTFTYVFTRACFAEDSDVVVDLAPQGDDLWLVSFASWSDSVNFAVSATVDGAQVQVEPERINLEDFYAFIESFVLEVPGSDSADEVCVTITPLDVEGVNPGTACYQR
ncbi:MAG: hypothetical protein GXO39_06115 [Thermotogae bacterium]|nr:hypothetical protein [Thermotogota bacterium]